MFTATMTLSISSGSVAVMSNSFYVNNLVASVQKRPLLALLRETQPYHNGLVESDALFRRLCVMRGYSVPR